MHHKIQSAKKNIFFSNMYASKITFPLDLGYINIDLLKHFPVI